jgi:outer membrane protein
MLAPSSLSPSKRLSELAVALGALVSLAMVRPAQAAPSSASEALSVPTPRAMTLADALAYARAHQPAIVAALSRVSGAREAAEVPRSQWLPRVGVTAQIFAATENNSTASTVVTMPEVDIPRIGSGRTVSGASARWNPYGSTLVAAGGTQEIFDFGRIAAESAAADAKVEIATQSAIARQIDIEYGVQEAYFAVYAAKGVLATAEGAYQRAREHRDLAQAGVGSGLRSPIELTRATADLARYDLGRLRARGNVQVAQSVLAASIGVADIGIDTTGDLPQVTELPTLQQALDDASRRSPWLLEALARVKQQERETTAIRAEMRPNLQVTGTISGRSGGGPPTSGDQGPASGWAPGIPNWDVGLLLSWPLFDGTINARANASARLEAAQRADLEVARLTVTAAVDKAYVQLTVARDTLPGLQRALDGATSNYAQANARFGGGLGNAVELADAEALRTDAEVQLALGVFEIARARAALGRALAGGIAPTAMPTVEYTPSMRGFTHE